MCIDEGLPVFVKDPFLILPHRIDELFKIFFRVELTHNMCLFFEIMVKFLECQCSWFLG
jgi:hypothetical protein